MEDGLSEGRVTISLARWLGSRGWQIQSMALPGGGSGVTFYPVGANPRSGENRAITPDIVAVDDWDRVLVVESKPRPNRADAEKLLLLRSPEYMPALERTLRRPVPRLITGQSFGPPLAQDLQTRLLVSNLLDVGFSISHDLDVTVIWDHEDLFLEDQSGVSDA